MDESLSLFHEFADEEDIGGGTITYDVILGSGGPSDHACSWVLNLHFVQQDVSIFCEFDLTSTTDEPIKI